MQGIISAIWAFISYRKKTVNDRATVHIECLSMDDMEKFITNPGKAGEDAPVYLTRKLMYRYLIRGNRVWLRESEKQEPLEF